MKETQCLKQVIECKIKISKLKVHELKLSELDVKMRFLVKEVEKENNAGLDEKNCKINEMLDMH